MLGFCTKLHEPFLFTLCSVKFRVSALVFAYLFGFTDESPGGDELLPSGVMWIAPVCDVLCWSPRDFRKLIGCVFCFDDCVVV